MAFTRTGIYRILNHPIYAGHIRHRGTLHLDQPSAIIDQVMLDKVQALLPDHIRGERRSRTRASRESFADLWGRAG